MDCDDLYQKVISGISGDNYVLFDLAQCFLDGYDRSKLRAMLQSPDIGIVLDGLFIVSEVGNLATEYIDDLVALESSNDLEVKRRASELVGIYAPDRSDRSD